MYRRIEDFLNHFRDNTLATRKYLGALTDESLSQPVTEGHRTLGRIAWHLATTIPEMMSKTGLSPEGPGEDEPVPATAAEIGIAYADASDSLIREIAEKWTDETLLVEDDMYGNPWTRGFTLSCLVEHETHHRGQMSVLMRQAGLVVPGSMGPAKEEWATFGMEPPAV